MLHYLVSFSFPTIESFGMSTSLKETTIHQYKSVINEE
jgi:hypothetical protein